jgi:hypothetical protein
MVGSTGPSVVRLQNRLNARGAATPPLVADGQFGDMTRQAVVVFQSSSGLVPDGIAGPLTWSALGSAAGDQPSGEAEAPALLGPSTWADGSYGGGGSAPTGAGAGWTSGGTAEGHPPAPPDRVGDETTDLPQTPPPGTGEGIDACTERAGLRKVVCISGWKEYGCGAASAAAKAAGEPMPWWMEATCKAAANMYCQDRYVEELRACKGAKKGIAKWWGEGVKPPKP